MSKGLEILEAEHVSMAKVLSVLEDEMRAMGETGDVDLDLLVMIVNYIETVPDTFHHPKEEKYLFAAVARRDPEARAIVDELVGQHREEARMIADLRTAVEKLSMEIAMDKEAFVNQVTGYVAFVRDHMEVEQARLFPIARKVLEPADWAAIDEAMAAHEDPLASHEPHERYDELLRRIVYLEEGQGR